MTFDHCPAATRTPQMIRVGMASFGLTMLGLLTLGARFFV
ncbi:hypothetical protein FHT01_001467 [Sphingomonas japonica]|uniref:Uncharacterized protein n=1 Tax=Sphingomonas japonica TaxID=511662 RepID=A0ABX0U046_9SPHN|nr:hypothetical protein [Sphingomonas japonica]